MEDEYSFDFYVYVQNKFNKRSLNVTQSANRGTQVCESTFNLSWSIFNLRDSSINICESTFNLCESIINLRESIFNLRRYLTYASR